MLVIPSPLTASVDELKAFIAKAESKVEIFQIDIDDGSFLANRTVLPEDLQGVKTSLRLDFHLMVKEPANWIERCVKAGGNRLIGQIEYMQDQQAFIDQVKSQKVKVGLALDIETPVDALEKVLLPQLDVVLLMDYPAGRGGQPFDDRVLGKIQVLSDLRREKGFSFRICCDGGIREETVKRVAEAGADEVTVGRPLFDGNIKDNVEELLSCL